MNKPPLAADALMLLSSHCSNCPSVLDSLSKMVKSGDIASLTVVNLEKTPDAATKYNVRSVPWVRIGKYELTGVQAIDALKQRAEWAAKDLLNDLLDKEVENTVANFDFFLSDGQVNNVIEAIESKPEKIQSIMELLGDSATVLSTRIGIGVVFEEFAKSTLVKSLIPQLAELGKHEDSRVRADVFHYLGLSGDKKAIPILKSALSNKLNKDVDLQEIIQDSIEELSEELP